MSTLQQSELKKLLHYCPETGVFTWKLSQGTVKKGSAASSVNARGYPRIGVNGKMYTQHRLAFLYMEGEFPPDGVDHINGIKEDNRWSNLRKASQRENGKNTKLGHNNTSGVSGVSYERKSNSWRARISVDGVRLSLGNYKHFFDAVAARKSAENKYNYHPNHGRLV